MDTIKHEMHSVLEKTWSFSVPNVLMLGRGENLFMAVNNKQLHVNSFHL